MDMKPKSFSEVSNGILDLSQHYTVLKFLSVISFLVFIPLSIKNFLINENALGTVLLLFEISLLFEVYANTTRKTFSLGHLIPVTLLIMSLILAIYIFGALATYWVFPIILSVVFLLPQTQALVVNTAIILGSSAAAIPNLEVSVIGRFVTAMFITAVVAHILVRGIRLLQSELRYLSTRDPLTGALNRHQLDTLLESARLASKPSKQACIAIIDIDFFKQINDQHGHDVGDEVISAVVQTITHNTEDTDTLFRLGGDEFLLLCRNTTELDVQKKLHYLSRKVKQHQYPQDATVTLSIGLAKCMPDDSVEAWFKKADLALYESKLAGRDTVTIHNAIDPNVQAISSISG
ncbi:GGDEF domain-containing protein [Vibrio sp. SCSIO 43135]|uniref:GGDEF domain-containing protein n=1 Tax=Vibrio sp. SCSIO 43135 TaxID=2819096 RepID=UPI0020751349|nr:GGDEF domain-containing protein [Vibrio sp. SCSIO 43135]USD42761.1 GGDEF domain-containing protein [Vibrio sp. SCSIO 43135]